MANLVKWWKQQFRHYKVIHECSTDSEELIHASEYGDVIMQQKENIIHHNLESSNHTVQSSHKTPATKANIVKGRRISKEQDFVRERCPNDLQERLKKRHSIATTHNLDQLEASQSKYNKISCDVSLEDSFEKSQPMNFTFTLYDLDGHGIITKEDIASIVSTIYDSINNGKTISAPIYGKKVINVKLTMSPQDTIKTHDSNHRIKKHVSSTQRHLRTSISQNQTESLNVVPVMKFQNDITSQEISRNCEKIEGDKNNLYESINNLKGYKPSIEKIFTKNIKTENFDTKTYPESNIAEKLKVDENDQSRNDESKGQVKTNLPKKRILRKQRNQKQKLLEKAARGRSLSVGNDYRWKQNQNQKLSKTTELNNGSKLRRNELIEIIRESMEKNKLCFQQSNRKTTNTENIVRQRSNTITMMEAQIEHGNNINHCGFDSYLHSTLCDKIDNPNKMKQIECMMHKHQPAALTLKTSLLNQLNPTLTPEQKLARKLNDIEKWLIERESATKIKTTADKNVLNQMKSDKLSSEIIYETKNALSPKMITPRIEKSLPRCQKLQKDAINSIKNKNIAGYPMNIYLDELEKLRECENLISSSENDDEECPVLHTNVNDSANKKENQQDNDDGTLKASSVRFVHIHHHYYHFDENKTENDL